MKFWFSLLPVWLLPLLFTSSPTPVVSLPPPRPLRSSLLRLLTLLPRVLPPSGMDTTDTTDTLPMLMQVVSLPMLMVPLPLPRPPRLLLLSKLTLLNTELLPLPFTPATLHGVILALLPTLMVLLSLLNPQRLLLPVPHIWLPMPLLKRTN